MRDLYDKNDNEDICIKADVDCVRFDESLLKAVIGDKDIDSVLRKTKGTKIHDGLVMCEFINLLQVVPTEEQPVGLPEYREDIIWLLFILIPAIINDENCEYVKSQFLAKWNTLSQLLTKVCMRIFITRMSVPRLKSVSLEEDIGTWADLLENSSQDEWIYELKDGSEKNYFGKKEKFSRQTVEITRDRSNKITADDFYWFQFEDQRIKIAAQYLDTVLKEMDLKLEAFPFLYTADGRCYTVERVMPRPGGFFLNGNAIKVGIYSNNEFSDKYSGKNENIWNTWNEEIFLALSMISEYELYPFPGANSHARDLKYTMVRSDVHFFDFLASRCKPGFSARCFINFLMVQDAMNKNGLQLLTEILSRRVVTKKNGTLSKARTCTIEPEELFPKATDTLRIAFKCKNVADDNIEIELLCNFCTGKDSYVYDDNFLNICTFEQFKKYYQSANF